MTVPEEWQIYDRVADDDFADWPLELARWTDVAKLEKDLRIHAPAPILVDPNGNCDAAISRYLSSPKFRSLAKSSRISYLSDCRLFFTFLSMQDKSWRNAEPDDIDEFEQWRRFDKDNPRRIGGPRWNRGLAAIAGFYDWMVARREISYSPVLRQLVHVYGGREIEVPVARANEHSPSDVKWLTPRAYRAWRDIGLRGYDKSGEIEFDWLGRCENRNVTFADFLFNSGLRRREAGAMLEVEVPEALPDVTFPHGWVASAVAKRARRYYWVSRGLIADIRSYCATTRAEAVRQAQIAGRYERIRGLRIVTVSEDQKSIQWTDPAGRIAKMNVDHIDAEERLTLFKSTPNGLEPLALWLTEAGEPLHHTTWNAVFKTANRRCRDNDVKVRCSPKMLRHSFALKMLVSIQFAFAKRLKLSENEQEYLREIYGDVWTLVKDLLGHRSIDTTRAIYLEPVSGLRLQTLFTEELFDASELIQQIAGHTGLILDFT